VDVSVFNLVHTLTLLEYIPYRVEQRVVEETSTMVLVGTNIVWILIGALAHCEDTCS
jgi:hypothetical protein